MFTCAALEVCWLLPLKEQLKEQLKEKQKSLVGPDDGNFASMTKAVRAGCTELFGRLRQVSSSGMICPVVEWSQVEIEGDLRVEY